MRRWLAVLLCLFLVVLPTGWVSAKDNAPPAPKLMGIVQPSGTVQIHQLPPPSDITTPGAWFLGATPPNVDLSKPPIVFVQGMNGRAQDWWDETEYHGINDMYEKAYQYGYRTAFVQLYDAGGNPSNQWKNGQLLASMLEQIYNHFGQKVNIVAHSKGGPDTQAALIHYGAYRFVGRVVTLSSPHYGSPLADLAYSWWAGWLAELLGQRSEATYSLQTGEMARYREMTDNHPNARLNTYYTAAGTDWGPAFSALAMGGLYLSQYGSNDGLVNVWSTYLPYGQHLFTIDVDHDQIRTGSTSFWRIEPYLRSASVSAVQAASAEKASIEEPKLSTNQYIHGGPLTAGKPVEENFYVDANAKEMQVYLLTASPKTKITLISPSGRKMDASHSTYRRSVDRAFFQGAIVQGLKVPKPENGTWKLVLEGKESDAYLLLAGWDGTEAFDVKLPSKAKALTLPVNMKISSTQWVDPASVHVQIKAVKADTNAPVPQTRLSPQARNGTFVGQLRPNQPGVYNLTLEIQGKTKEGKPFTRTVVKSVYIGK